MKFTDYFRAPFQWAWLLVAKFILDLIGLVVVAIAIPFARWEYSVSDGRRILNLPRWAHLWGNDFDGLLGDKRGDWAKITPWHVDVKSFLAKYWWTAIRNPSNNMRRYRWFAAPISGSIITYKGDYAVEDDPGKGGWQFVNLISASGKPYYGFYFVWQWNGVRCFMVRIGFKVFPRHQGTFEQPKGLTFRLNPWKKL